MKFLQDIDPEEEAAVEKFMAKREGPATRTLFDIIQEKIEQKKFELETMSLAQNGVQVIYVSVAILSPNFKSHIIFISSFFLDTRTGL